ncbi:PIGA [Symbiodinium microadriaticum]|nr:PIGA [Symbiodinium microadriaticum]
MTNGLKVFYLPLTVVYDQIIFPTFFSFFPLFRNILIRERISIVHGHQSTSPMTNEAILYARALGYKVCYTDHSLFGFDDLTGIHLNKMLKFILSDIDHAICVSNTCRENLVLRAQLHPSMVSTIPNAVDPTKFTPDPSLRSPAHTVNIVMLSRLVYRKGIDIAVKLIPRLCAEFPAVHFIIGGDGPKKLLLEEMLERHQLHDRVELLGVVSHDQVRDVLVRGHIFLNCSLTESFCIALLEAASCGLFVVTTKVGGVPEVLPLTMIKFTEPSVDDLFVALSEAVSMTRRVVPNELHQRIILMYSWMDVSERTERIYNDMVLSAFPSLASRFLRLVPPFTQ